MKTYIRSAQTCLPKPNPDFHNTDEGTFQAPTTVHTKTKNVGDAIAPALPIPIDIGPPIQAFL